ncbi:MOSC domain-containing protein [Flagellimonas sp. HMM57]|uniref:MOSC domain-containing protein n=1 Tax=unclassified Flagellimonas TaxID=2644544 RepID=UPI0013D2D03C|nr:MULTISPECIES: MOSC domain-containing protein [unclassified Flagellimonas]UII76577.1 MOSC domain-containing protein [Flagellimonas sp. HMM57]
MKVISTNIAEPTTIFWNGKQEETGIYKYPTEKSLLLEQENVEGDVIIDRKHHGGEFKACYLFSSDDYPYWREKYPQLEWNWGMFGENLTIEGLDESKLRIGNIYKIGNSLVQITQPREPCYKLGIRFGTQEILKQFIDHERPGTYVKILKVGEVQTGDTMELVKESENTLTIQQFYKLLFARKKDKAILKLALNNDGLPKSKKEKLKKYV